MPNIELDHCVINVSDWNKSNKFYAEVIGAEIIPVGNGYSYRIGKAQLNCHGPKVHATPIAKVPVLPGGSDLCFIWPTKIEEAILHLNDFGVDVEVGPVKRFGSKGDGISVYFRDPDGSLLEFISYN